MIMAMMAIKTQMPFAMRQQAAMSGRPFHPQIQKSAKQTPAKTMAMSRIRAEILMRYIIIGLKIIRLREIYYKIRFLSNTIFEAIRANLFR